MTARQPGTETLNQHKAVKQGMPHFFKWKENHNDKTQ